MRDNISEEWRKGKRRFFIDKHHCKKEGRSRSGYWDKEWRRD